MEDIGKLYDEVAAGYDRLYEHRLDRNENAIVSGMLRGYTEGQVIDLGCGTGLALSLDGISPERYLGVDLSRGMAQAWPKWFEKVCERLPGVRTASMFGKRSVTPMRPFGKTWEYTYKKYCIDEAPEWIADRSRQVMDHYLKLHARHSSYPFPDVMGCSKCGEQFGSWKRLAMIMFMGDPFSLKLSVLPPVEPEFFRKGWGTWEGGKPSW